LLARRKGDRIWGPLMAENSRDFCTRRGEMGNAAAERVKEEKGVSTMIELGG